jgi:hypothetical protein
VTRARRWLIALAEALLVRLGVLRRAEEPAPAPYVPPRAAHAPGSNLLPLRLLGLPGGCAPQTGSEP